jgi:hypothetical protein
VRNLLLPVSVYSAQLAFLARCTAKDDQAIAPLAVLPRRRRDFRSGDSLAGASIGCGKLCRLQRSFRQI